LINITLNIDEKKFNADLERSFVNYNRNIKRFKEKVTEDVRTIQRENIMQSRAIEGGNLEPLSPVTVFIKTKLGYTHPNLPAYATSNLSKAFISENVSDDVSNVTIDSVNYYKGYNVYYGLNQWGYSQPERHFFGLSVYTDKAVEKRNVEFNLNENN